MFSDDMMILKSTISSYSVFVCCVLANGVAYVLSWYRPTSGVFSAETAMAIGGVLQLSCMRYQSVRLYRGWLRPYYCRNKPSGEIAANISGGKTAAGYRLFFRKPSFFLSYLYRNTYTYLLIANAEAIQRNAIRNAWWRRSWLIFYW